MKKSKTKIKLKKVLKKDPYLEKEMNRKMNILSGTISKFLKN